MSGDDRGERFGPIEDFDQLEAVHGGDERPQGLGD
jgi:hypothetical protein